ncbi:hypothetical protein, partial [Neisseria sicca]|uniref:hypothetical protein n=1 Tax=Neisseria sicca TaxID=490 RepID=UPI001C997B20
SEGDLEGFGEWEKMGGEEKEEELAGELRELGGYVVWEIIVGDIKGMRDLKEVRGRIRVFGDFGVNRGVDLG